MNFYKSLKEPVKTEVYRVKGSKFLGYAFPINSREEIAKNLETLKSQHPKANHCCYAWKLGTIQPEIRYSDDGEPTNSSGKPIFGQILSYEVTNVLVAVIRYFGGTKLGVGGLIQAYREAARMSLEEGEIVVRDIKCAYSLHFEYARLDRVMRLIKENQLEIVSQEMEMDVVMLLHVKKEAEESFLGQIEGLRDVKVTKND